MALYVAQTLSILEDLYGDAWIYRLELEESRKLSLLKGLGATAALTAATLAGGAMERVRSKVGGARAEAPAAQTAPATPDISPRDKRLGDWRNNGSQVNQSRGPAYHYPTHQVPKHILPQIKIKNRPPAQILTAPHDAAHHALSRYHNEAGKNLKGEALQAHRRADPHRLMKGWSEDHRDEFDKTVMQPFGERITQHKHRSADEGRAAIGLGPQIHSAFTKFHNDQSR